MTNSYRNIARTVSGSITKLRAAIPDVT